ncbi:DUF3263 domain-containing protein [Streptomyces sp. NPDC088727]|uniref:DUF3263 domain-containing protein n=1 Tax=Streptomyces sp. NPDC088727 TaxID=3365875 RepID=UPI00381384EE
MSTPPEAPGDQGLSELHRRILDGHDRLSSLAAGPRERFIREQFGMKPVLYFQLLNALINSVDALEYAPVTVNRLRRVREANRIRRQPQ